MYINLKDIATKTEFIFPMPPEEIQLECGTRFASYDIMNIGEIKLPLGEELTRFSWSCKLPGKKRQGVDKKTNALTNPYLQSLQDPKAAQEWFSYLRNQGIKCHLLVTETPINHDVYLENYSMTYAGGFGDYDCTISFVHAKELKVTTENLGGQTTAKAVAPPEQQRAEKPAESTYIIKGGDCLWDIAQLKLGNANRFQEIAALNAISNPNAIYPGQVLLLPKK